MKKKVCRVYILIFVLMTALPYLLYLYVAKHLDLENHENHELTTMGDVIEAPWYEKTTVLENEIDDHLPYKNELMKLNTLVDIKVFGNLDSDSVMLGKDNWLFYKLDNCIEDYQRSLTVSQEEMDAMLVSMQNMQQYCDENGIQLVYLITPNKETIYGELYMPDYVKRSGNISRVDTILDTLESKTNLTVVYPCAELIKYRNLGYQTYKKYDTHWNQVGAYVGTECLFSKLGVDIEPLQNVEIKSEGEITGDLANMIAMGNIFNDDTDWKIENYKSQINVDVIEERQETSLNYSHYQSDAGNGKVIMCIGDSFLEAMEPYIAKNYSESYFMHITNYPEGEIERVKPDIIVISSTERAFPGLYWSLNAMMEKLEMD